MSDQWAHLPHHNEACAFCGHPAEIHPAPGQPPPPPNSTWAKACRRFVRHQPPRAAYGELPGVDHRELLRKYIAHVCYHEGFDYIDRIGDGAYDCPVNFTAEEKAELVRLASEEAG